jgi:hypothetical protein
MTTIDLRTAKPGDVCMRRDGKLVIYKGPFEHRVYKHQVGVVTYTDAGLFDESGEENDQDIIKILYVKHETIGADTTHEEVEAAMAGRLGEPKPPRKIVQIAALPAAQCGNTHHFPGLVVLCNDGSVWARYDSPGITEKPWERLPDIPQD